MKKRAITLTVLAAATVAVCFGLRPSGELPPPAVDPATLYEGTLAVNQEPAEVFKRALWRRPGTDDSILHAERREWTKNPADGAAHWQWFLAVKPGEALEKWLRGQNPFLVRPRASLDMSGIKGAPAWFPWDAAGYDIQAGGSQGNLVFLFSGQDGVFYATGSGTGFAPGVAEAVAGSAASVAAARGRLPLTPPPILPKP